MIQDHAVELKSLTSVSEQNFDIAEQYGRRNFL